MSLYNSTRKVITGRLYALPGVLAAVPLEALLEALRRHQSGDWGEICDEDKRANNRALHSGERLLSAYRAKDGMKFWIITEADRSVTTFLLPSEY